MKSGKHLILFFLLTMYWREMHAQLIISDDTTICEGTAVLHVLSEASHATTDYTVVSLTPSSEIHAGTDAFPTGFDDINTGAVNLGFSFCFYGNSYTKCYISTNGWLSFSNPPPSWNTVYGPGADFSSPVFTLPNTNPKVPKNAVMGPWQDWYPNYVGTVCKYQTLGTAPYRRFVVSFKDMQMFSCYADATGSYQMILYETTNIIQSNIIYKENCPSWENGKATLAIHNSTGTKSVEIAGRDATAWTAGAESWAYIPSVVEWYDSGLLVGTGDSLSVSPAVTTTYTAILEACDGSTYTDEVTVYVEPNDASFTYPAGFPGYCQSGSMLPTYIASPGGTFSADPPDLIIDPVTGEVDLSSGSTGTSYIIKYLLPSGICQDSAFYLFDILEWDDSTFYYDIDTVCPEGFAAPVYIGSPGGNFSVSPFGLVVNPSTGNIDLSTGTVGTTYTITYVTGGYCPTSLSVDITIDPLDDPSFSYDSSHYCPGGTALPTVTTSGGSFSISPSSMDIDAATGEVDLSTGISGTTYTITYSTPFPCVATSTETIFIDPADDASFAYDASSYCPTGTASPVYITIPGGSFTVTPAGLIVDPVTGEADLTSGSIGTVYAITYTTPAGPCQNSGTETILIDPLDDPLFTYADTAFCPYGFAIPVYIASPGGSFTISPPSAVINASTGSVDLSTVVPGSSYTVSYLTAAGPCQNSSSVTITILTVTEATFSYTPSVFCNTGSALPAVVYPGGSFTAEAGIVVNSSTGEIDLNTSIAGDYDIYYASPGCGETDTFSVTINPLPALTMDLQEYVCLEGDPVKITASPAGGVISGTGVEADVFYPDIAGSAGDYSIAYTYTDSNSCTATLIKSIEVIENIVDAGPDVSIYEQGHITLHADGGDSFLWSPDYQLSCTGCASPVASPFETTTYIVTSYDAYGCVDTDDVTVVVIPVFDSTVFVPNTFTPNGDGLNDVLFAFGSDITLIKYFSVYDRWGELLWSRDNLSPTDFNAGWDGTAKGMEVKDGVYAFVIDVILENGADILRKGNVTVLR